MKTDKPKTKTQLLGKKLYVLRTGGDGNMGVFGNKKAVYNAIKTCIVESGYEIENNFIAYSKFCRKLEYYIDLEASSIYFQVEMFRLNNF